MDDGRTRYKVGIIVDGIHVSSGNDMVAADDRVFYLSREFSPGLFIKPRRIRNQRTVLRRAGNAGAVGGGKPYKMVCVRASSYAAGARPFYKNGLVYSRHVVVRVVWIVAGE